MRPDDRSTAEPAPPATTAAGLVRVVALAVALALASVLALAGAGAAPAAAAPAAAAEPSPGAQLPPSATPPAEADRTADDILAAPEYQPPEPTILDRILNWIGEQLAKLFQGQRQAPGGGGRNLGAWLVLGVLVVVAGLLAWRFVKGRSRGTQHEEPFDIELTLLRSADEWRSEAERLEAEQAWKPALRARYRALVAELVDRGVVGDLPGRTTGEYRVEVRRAVPGAAGAFSGASELFERAWYGNLPTGGEENARVRALSADVLAAVEAGAATPAEGPAPLEVPA